MEQHTYLVIDLKSFYASVECAERGLDPMTENTCQSLLTGLMVYFTQLHDEYPDNVEVLEEDEPSSPF